MVMMEGGQQKTSLQVDSKVENAGEESVCRHARLMNGRAAAR
jgi:hypothetical protein